jgi:hypothetical protein
MGTLRLLEAIRTATWPIRFYQAGSSEMFGQHAAAAIESSPFIPEARTRSPSCSALDDGAVPRRLRLHASNGSCSTTNRRAEVAPS